MPTTTSLQLDDGSRLLHDLQRDLPTLSPKLGNVARFCIEHASTLHHYRIHEVARACETIPASVVRLAQRFGLNGFQEMKYALVDRVERGPVAEPQPREPWQHPDCLAALQGIEDSALGLASLKGLVSRPEFHRAVQALRTARRIHFDGAGEEDRLIAAHLQTRLRELGCLPLGTRDHDAACNIEGDTPFDGAWLVRVAVWNDLTPGSQRLDPAAFGPRVLRLARGRMNRFAARDHAGIVMHVGTGAQRLLNALALCEAIATAVKPGAMRHD